MDKERSTKAIVAAAAEAVHTLRLSAETAVFCRVEHPMYTATLLLYLAMPIVLGSWYAAVPMLAYPFIIVRRIKQEEALLKENLEGYADYMNQVRFRLLPFLW